MARRPLKLQPKGNARGLDYLPFAVACQQRFWIKTRRDPSGCWLWIAGVDKDGYGSFTITLPRLNGRQQLVKIRAPRLAYEIMHGRVPAGLLVLHTCDTPACCNPAHLEAGTQLKNRRDAVARGRVPKGDRHHMAKLSEAQAREAIRQRKAGVPTKEIASRFGIAIVTVQQLGSHNWRHLA